MTPFSSRLENLLHNVRDLTRRCMVGDGDSFRDLVQLLLSCTILKNTANIRLFTGKDAKISVLGGWKSPETPLPLSDGNYLGFFMQIFVDEKTGYLKVSKSKYQYQLDDRPVSKHWIFRYEYIRDPPDHHPAAHLHVRGNLLKNCLPMGELEHVHFPTHRVSLEAVIRLLVDHFEVPCNEKEAVWRPVLLEAEKEFLKVAHPPISSRQGQPRRPSR